MDLESRHQCLVYEGSPSKQLPALAAMIKRKLADGHRCLYLNSRPMVSGLRSFLAAMGIDVERAVAEGSLILSSDLLTTESGDFDVALMLGKLEEAVDRAVSDGYRGLWATGDMTWEFGAERNFAKLMEYEYSLEHLMQKRPQLSGVCQYHQDLLPAGLTETALQTHRTVFVNEATSRVNPKYVPLGKTEPAA